MARLPQQSNLPGMFYGNSSLITTSTSTAFTPPTIKQPNNSGLTLPSNVMAASTYIKQEEPFLEILTQPIKRGYRFRYASEGVTHGGISGEPSPYASNKKCYPTIKLHNHRGPARIVLTLSTEDMAESFLHPHSLVIDKQLQRGYHVFNWTGHNEHMEMKSIAVQHVMKKKTVLINTIMDRICQGKFIKDHQENSGFPKIGNAALDVDDYVAILQDQVVDAIIGDSDDSNIRNLPKPGFERDRLKLQAGKLSKLIRMDVCRLRFQAFLPDCNGKFTRVLPPVYSQEFYHKQTAHGSSLKIMKLSKSSSPVTGGEEVWMITDKFVEDIMEVRFYEEDKDGNLKWEDNGVYLKSDVHKQFLVIFKTPPYHNLNIKKAVTVNLQLRRKNADPKQTDMSVESLEFMYNPKNNDPYGIEEKRKKRLFVPGLPDYTSEPNGGIKRIKPDPLFIQPQTSNTLMQPFIMNPNIYNPNFAPPIGAANFSGNDLNLPSSSSSTITHSSTKISAENKPLSSFDEILNSFPGTSLPQGNTQTTVASTLGQSYTDLLVATQNSLANYMPSLSMLNEISSFAEFSKYLQSNSGSFKDLENKGL